MGKVNLQKRINLIKPKLRPYLNLYNGNGGNGHYIGGNMSGNMSSYFTARNLSFGLAGALIFGSAYLLGRGCREDNKVKPEKVNTFRVSEEYEGVLVEPNGYFISISEIGELVGLNINGEKTPFNFTETRRKDRSLKERNLEKFLEVSGKPITIGPESETPTAVRIKKRN